MEGGDRSLGKMIYNNQVDAEALTELIECKTEIEFGHIRVKAWMLARAITLDLLVRQTDVDAKKAGQASLDQQLEKLAKILSLLKDDKSPNSKWTGLLNKLKVTPNKIKLMEFLPQL